METLLWKRRCFAWLVAKIGTKKHLRLQENRSEECRMQQDSISKACVHCGSPRINKKASGIISTKRSGRLDRGQQDTLRRVIKTIGTQASWIHQKEFKTVYGWKVESHESTSGNFAVQKHLKIALQAKGFTSVTQYDIWCTSLCRCHKRWNIPDAKAAECTRNGRSSRQSQHGNWRKVKSKKEVILDAPRVKKNVHFATLMDICHIKHCAVRTESTEMAESCSGETL